MFIAQNKKYPHSTRGYTLIELVVAVGLFTIVVLMTSSSFLGVMAANRKTLAVRTAMDNLNAAIENMSRSMKTGSAYHCGSGGDISAPRDCSSGGTYLSFEGQNGDPNTSSDQIVYLLGPAGACLSSKQICVSNDGGTTFAALTAPPPELSVDGFAFRVYGSDPSGVPAKQPRVVIVMIGSAGLGTAQSTFNIETTVSQRLPNQL